MHTVKAAAARLGVSQKTVYLLCSRKRLRHVRVGLGRGKILVPEDAVEEYLRRHTVGGEGAAPPPKPARVRLQHLRV